MIKIPLIQVDAFATQVFEGNPAAVCLLEKWLSDEMMQLIASENNLSETAFIVQEGDGYGLRWFTPVQEVDMCGHATLASAYVIFEKLEFKKEKIRFFTRSGDLIVKKKSEMYIMDFPLLKTEPLHIIDTIESIFYKRPLAIFGSMDIVVVFENEEDVRSATPDFFMLKKLERRGVALTAASDI